jgi:hypothetical protein
VVRGKGYLFYDTVSAAVEDMTEWLSAMNSKCYGGVDCGLFPDK